MSPPQNTDNTHAAPSFGVKGVVCGGRVELSDCGTDDGGGITGSAAIVSET